MRLAASLNRVSVMMAKDLFDGKAVGSAPLRLRDYKAVIMQSKGKQLSGVVQFISTISWRYG